MGEAAAESRDTIGMTAEEMHAYLEVLLAEEAAEAAAARGTTVEEELDSAGFAAARAASSYAISSSTPTTPTSRATCSIAVCSPGRHVAWNPARPGFSSRWRSSAGLRLAGAGARRKNTTATSGIFAPRPALEACRSCAEPSRGRRPPARLKRLAGQSDDFVPDQRVLYELGRFRFHQPDTGLDPFLDTLVTLAEADQGESGRFGGRLPEGDDPWA